MTHTFTADGSEALEWRGGEGQVAAQGTFGGGTLSLQFSLDNGSTWTNLEDDPASTIAANGSFAFRSMKTDPESYKLRLNLSGATSPNLKVRVGNHL